MAAGESRDPDSDNTTRYPISVLTDENDDSEISEVAAAAIVVLRRLLGSWRQQAAAIRNAAALGRTSKEVQNN